MESVSPIFLILINVVLGSVAQLLLKMGTNAAGGQASILSLFTRWQVLIGFGLYGFASILWLKILQNPSVSLSFAYPMIAMSYVVVTALDRLVLKDPVPPMRIVGLIFICIGVALVGMAGKKETKVSTSPATGPHEVAEVTLMDLPLPPSPAATPLPHHIPPHDA